VLAGAACAALAILIVAGILIKVRVKTPDGEAVVVVEVDQAGAEVVVDGGKITVKVPGDNQPVEIKLEPGQHKLRISKAGFEAVARDIEVKAGKSAPIRVRLLPVDPDASAISKAKEVYRQAMKNAGARLLAGFDRELDALAKAKTRADDHLVLIAAVKAEKVRFEKQGRIPWSAPMRLATREYLLAMEINRLQLSKSFDRVIKLNVEKKEPDKVREYESQRTKVLEPELVAIWQYNIGGGLGGPMELFSDGSIGRDKERPPTWTLNGDQIITKWPGPPSPPPGGYWIDTCTLSSRRKKRWQGQTNLGIRNWVN